VQPREAKQRKSLWLTWLIAFYAANLRRHPGLRHRSTVDSEFLERLR
jgi:hypothetical protein